MILGPVSLIDCAVFCLFLAPQLIYQVGLIATVSTTLQCLPFLLLTLPVEFLWERYLAHEERQSKFVKDATVFEDIVIRCVRYAFSHVPANVGRVFFSKAVALPFARWRMLRHGYLSYPVSVEEVCLGQGEDSARGVWIGKDEHRKADFVLYYVHGGGFAMGSSYFYLEFLMALQQLLKDSGFKNPAVFALEYTLAPDERYPRQLDEVIKGYEHVLSTVGNDASRVCVGGDSAGGTLVLSLLLVLGARKSLEKTTVAENGSAPPELASLPLPQMSILISPWVTLKNPRHVASHVDFLDRETLWLYAKEYAGEKLLHQSPASPGCCTDDLLWRAATPARGYFVVFGDQEVFAPDIDDFIENQKRLRIEVTCQMFRGGVHAWPVASLFLSSTIETRLLGLRTLVTEVRKRCQKEKS